MSEPVSEPGAPVDGATNLPPASEKSIAAEAKKQAPPTLTKLAATPDRILLRLNKLLATPGGLSSFLSTFNYTLYLLAYLEAKSIPLRLKLQQVLNNNTTASKTLPALDVSAPSNIAALGAMLSSTRTTLRLLGLLPMYAWFRQLMQGPKPGQDSVLYTTQVTQCVLYLTFQFLENVGVLTDGKVLPASYTARWGPTPRIFLWSYRAWMGGVLCDFVRLFREAQLEGKRRRERVGSQAVAEQEQDKKTDERWWAGMVVPLAWTPVAAQFSIEGGLPGFNLGVMGACGAMAGLGRFAELWAATAD